MSDTTPQPQPIADSILDLVGRTPLVRLRVGDGTGATILGKLVLVGPRLKGTELASWMQTRWPGTPALLVSGYTDDEAVGAWADADPASFLTKPFEPQELLDRVEQRLASV